MNKKQLLEYAVDLLAPRSCVFCGISCINNEQQICAPCHDDLPWCDSAVSPSPGKFACRIALLEYDFPVDVAIKRFKFNRKLYYGSAFAEILCRASPLLPRDIDAVLPVPLHWFRKARRGFNQATELAKPVATQLGVPLLRNVVRTRSTPFQSGLGAAERARNLRDVFAVRGSLDYRHVLIIDDIVTTGTTLLAMATVLQRAGIKRVSALCIARAR